MSKIQAQLFDNNPRHLWRRYVVALVLIFLSVLVLNFAPKASLNTIEASADIIDVAGKQRMLSQRILFFATLAASDAGSSQDSHAKLRAATSEFVNSQKRLSEARISRDRATHHDDHLKLDLRLDEKAAAFVALAQKIEEDLEPAQRKTLITNLIAIGSTDLLSELDAAVQRDEGYTVRKVQRVKTIANAAFILALVVILLSALLIFLPSHRTIIKFLAERETFEDSLIEKNEELEHFTYIASHDLRAPLRGMENLVTWIDADVPAETTEETRSHLDLLRKRITRMNGLLSDMLAFAKIGKNKPNLTTFDLREAMEEVITWVEVPPGFSINLPAYLPTVTAARSTVQQICLNLFKNGIKHHDKKSGQINLEYSVKDNNHIFIVADDGPGIPAKYREYIFKPFQRLAARDVVEGSGIGLSITRKFVTSLGGTIEVLDPEAGVTRGTRFRLSLPILYPESQKDNPAWRASRGLA
ncbi:ATP-binding protein [Hellea sp.]|nr:ATP-binding protein [Hellea sp.]